MLSGIFIFSTFFFYIYWNFLSNNLKLIGIFLWLFQSVIYLITSLINPGTPTPEYYLENYDLNKTKIKTFRICSKCKLVMDLSKGTEHCNECDICIMGINHHCTLISKCIGKKNLYFFYLFVAFTVTLFLYFGFCIFL